MCLIAAGDSAPNGPLDAATLDIIASGLWGRAESVRTLIRGVFEPFARLAFGIVSTTLAGASAGGWGTGVDSDHMAPSLGEAVPLRNTFLILVVALVGAGVLILRVRRHNPSDVLNAIEYEERSRADSKSSTQQTGMEAEQFRTGA